MAFNYLANYKNIELITFRKNGTGVPTPVWFALNGDKLYVLTEKKSYKVKRLLNNPKATISPCTFRGKVLGESVNVVGRLLEGDEAVSAKNILDEVWNKRFLTKLMKLSSLITFWKKDSEDFILEFTPI